MVHDYTRQPDDVPQHTTVPPGMKVWWVTGSEYLDSRLAPYHSMMSLDAIDFTKSLLRDM